MASILSSPHSSLLHNPFSMVASLPIIKPTLHFGTPNPKFSTFSLITLRRPHSIRPLLAVAEGTSSVTAADPSSEAARRLYVGNIPRKLDNAELTQIVEEYGSVENVQVMYDKYSGRSRRFAFVTMKTIEDANAVIEKLNGTEIGGRVVKINVTEKPLGFDSSMLQAEDSPFIDSPHKVYVGNLSNTVTTDTLKQFFSDKGTVLSAKVSRVPGTSKSSGYGFVSFSSEKDVEAAISSFNGAVLEGQKVRVNKA